MIRDPPIIEDLELSYVLGELGEADAAAFECELTADADLAAEVRDLWRAFAVVPYATVADPPSDLRARVLAAAEAAEASTRPAESAATERAGRRAGPDAASGRRAAPDAASGRRTPERTRADEGTGPDGGPRAEGRTRVEQRTRVNERRRPWWSIAATAVAAGFALVFALDAHHLRRELTLEREVAGLLQQPNVVVSFALAGTGTAGSAYGRIALDMDGAKGALAARGLPVAPSGHVYRVWAVSGGKDVLCGQFSADSERAARAQFVVPVNAYKGAVERVFVTLEPLAETPQPTGPRVLESS